MLAETVLADLRAGAARLSWCKVHGLHNEENTVLFLGAVSKWFLPTLNVRLYCYNWCIIVDTILSYIIAYLTRCPLSRGDGAAAEPPAHQGQGSLQTIDMIITVIMIMMTIIIASMISIMVMVTNSSSSVTCVIALCDVVLCQRLNSQPRELATYCGLVCQR